MMTGALQSFNPTSEIPPYPSPILNAAGEQGLPDGRGAGASVAIGEP